MRPLNATEPTAEVIGLPGAGASGDRRQALHVLTLGLGGDVFAVETATVHEVLDLVPLTEVPGAAAHLRGLINVRGRVVPVVDLKTRFGMGRTEDTQDTRIIVIEAPLRGTVATVGLLADHVFEVAELPAASLDNVPRLGMTWPSEFIRALAKREDDVVVVMDVERLFDGRTTHDGRAS
jgi:purine-binding chemotaxis protein CheW